MRWLVSVCLSLHTPFCLFGLAVIPAWAQAQQAVPGEADTLEEPGKPEDPAPLAPGLLRQVRFDATWIPRGGAHGFGINDLELSTTFALPLVGGWEPLLLTPAFAARLWDGLDSTAFPGRPDLPAQVYDVSLDIGWRQRLARWLFADVGLTPGLYSDFHDLTTESFRLRGRAVGIVAFSPQWQLTAGVLYVNRLHTKVLPTGGVIWRPDDGTRFEVLFPQPKISRKLTTTGTTQWWGYVMGEFGGGSWTVERASGAEDLADYRDLRLLLGMEWVGQGGLKSRLELGYVFQREISHRSPSLESRPASAVLIRGGISF